MDTKIWIVLFIIVLVLIYYYYTTLKKEESDDPSSKEEETLGSKYPTDPTQLTILLNSKERTVSTLSSTMPDSPRITELQQEIEEIKALLNNSTSSTPINIETPKDLLDYIISESDKLETTYQIIKQNAEGLSDIRTSSDVPALVSKLNTMFNYSVAINNYFTSMLPSLVEVSKDTKDIENIRESIGIICMNVSQIISVLYHDNIMDMFSVYNEILPKNVASMNAADKTSAMITYLNSIKTIVLNHANNYQLYINVMNSLVDVDSTSSSLSDFISANISDMYKVVKEDLDELTSFILSFDKNEYNVTISDVVTKISEYKVANDKFKEYTDKEYNIDRSIKYSGLGSSSSSSLSLDAFLGIDPNKESMEYNIPGKYTQRTGYPNYRYFIRGKYYGPPGKLYTPHSGNQTPATERYLNAGFRAEKEEDAGIIIEPFTTPEGYPVTKYEIKDDKLDYVKYMVLSFFNHSQSIYGNFNVCIINKMAVYNIHGERVLDADIDSSSSTTYYNVVNASGLKGVSDVFSSQSQDLFRQVSEYKTKPNYNILLKDNDFLTVMNTEQSPVTARMRFADLKNRPYTIVLAYNKKLISKYMDLDKFKKTMDIIMGGTIVTSSGGMMQILGNIQDLNDKELGYIINLPISLGGPNQYTLSMKNTVNFRPFGLYNNPLGGNAAQKNILDEYKTKYLTTTSIPTPDHWYNIYESPADRKSSSPYMFPVHDKKDGFELLLDNDKVEILPDIAALCIINTMTKPFSYSKILRYTTIFPNSDLVMPLTDKVFYKNYDTVSGGLCIDEVQPDDIVLPSHEILLDVMNVKKKKANIYTFVVYDEVGMALGAFRILNYYNNNQKIQYVLRSFQPYKTLNKT